MISEEEFRAFCATGTGNGVDNSCSSSEGSAPARDRSWESLPDRQIAKWGEEQLKESSPIRGGDKVSSVTIRNTSDVRDALDAMSMSIDNAVSLAGGAIRGSHIAVDSIGKDYLQVQVISPINPDDLSEGYIESEIDVETDPDTGERTINYGTLFPYKEIREGSDGAYAVGDIAPNALTGRQKARIASVMMERFIESVSTAEKKGFARAEMLAVGDGRDDVDSGYRLWPQFGFDGDVPQDLLRKIPDEIAVKAAGISIPPHGSARIPQSTIVSGLRKQVSKLTIQQLISVPDGDRWWDKNGGSIELSLDLRDKTSPGYKRFTEMKAKVARLKKRNEGRAFCPTGKGNGVDNSCSSEESTNSPQRDTPISESDTITSASSVPINSGKQWRRADDVVMYRASDIPAQSLSDAESVTIIHGQMLNESIKAIGGISLDTASRICSPSPDRSTIVIASGTLSDTEAYFDDPENNSDVKPALTYFTKIDVGDVESAVAIGTTLAREEDGRLVLQYGMLDVKEEARASSSVSIAREMYKAVSRSITEAEKAGVDEVVMMAAGSAAPDDRFRGYRIWPRLGFDGEIPRALITPVWSPLTGFFNSYGSSIPDRILSPRAKQEKKSGRLTIQALYETKEGQDWWEENGGPMPMSLEIGDEKSLGWRRFSTMRTKVGSRSISDDLYLEWLDVEWRSVAAEHRAFCATGDGGGIDNSCSSDDDSGPSAADQYLAAKSQKSEDLTPILWRSGDPTVNAYAAVSSSPPMSRGADGRISTSVYSREKEISSFAGKEYASPAACARVLLKETEAVRGRPINTRAELSGDEFEYMVSSLAAQVQSAQDRGYSPLFYSPGELKAQTDQYVQIHPVLKGGQSASGLCIGRQDSDGNCIETDSITPEGEFLFRAMQALTSPQANPAMNMQRADQALTHFLTESDPEKAKLGNAPAFSEGQRRQFEKLQSIIDKVGLTKAAELFSGPPMRAGDVEKFFSGLGIENAGVSTQYARDEVVPIFSIFGPKVGTFFANNTGNTEALTADVWFTRTWARLSGELLKETNPSLAKKHARELLKKTSLKHISEEDLKGTPIEDFVSALEQMKKTGEIPASVEAWATARFVRFGKEGFAKGVTKKKGVQYASVGNLSRSVSSNLVGVIEQPEGTVMRSNMIKVMKEVAKRTGHPVAYCQDLLWQDEQDVWGEAGSRTFMDVGEYSLYSEHIKQMVVDPSKRKPVKPEPKPTKKKASRSLGQAAAYEDVLGIGDVEQMAFEDDLSGINPDDFADAFIKFFSGEKPAESRNFAALDFGRKIASAIASSVAESLGLRAFCPNGEGGGVTNSCSSSEASGGSLESMGFKSFESSAASTQDARDAVDAGVRMLHRLGETVPPKIRIGQTRYPNAAAEFDPDTDEVVISDSFDADSMANLISSGFLTGDSSRPHETLVVHEASHSDHFDHIATMLGSSSEQESRWDRLSGYPQLLELRQKAKEAGKTFRPSAGTIEELAWAPEERFSRTSGPLNAQGARDVAAQVSEYAATNPLEFVAEVRTGVLMGKEYPDIVHALYADYGGPPIRSRKK